MKTLKFGIHTYVRKDVVDEAINALKDVEDYFSADYFLEGSETDKLIKRVQAAIADTEVNDD